MPVFGVRVYREATVYLEIEADSKEAAAKAADDELREYPVLSLDDECRSIGYTVMDLDANDEPLDEGVWFNSHAQHHDDGHCPACGSEEVEGEPFEVLENTAGQRMRCLECEATWGNEYVLSHYENLNAPNRKDC